MSPETPCFDTVYALLPRPLRASIDDLLSRVSRESTLRHTLDQLLRFSLTMDSSAHDLESQEEWDIQKKKLQVALSSMCPGAEKVPKRAREEDPLEPSDSDPKAKRLKLDPGNVGGADDDPIFALHAISTSAPVRKKVHITIHRDTIRFTHATSGALEAYIPIASLTRAFCIPTPGKSKPHWTVIIFTNAEQDQIIFGLEAIPPSLTTTTYPSPSTRHPKGTEAKPSLIQFFSHLPSRIVLQEPSTSEFRSAAGEPFLDAYLRAKDGHLLFFKDGILFGEKKPCMWIDMETIDSVRSLSATGRTFSLFVKRVGKVTDRDGEGEGEEGEETEFSMIDGKHQDSVARWVQENRQRFGISRLPRDITQNGTEEDERTADEDMPDKKTAENSEDSDDSDFESESESDGGSANSDFSDDGDGSGEEEGHREVGSDDDGDGEAGSDDDGEADVEETSLDPSKHPLLREGAMPGLSRRALDAVVGMVEEDFKSGSARGGIQGTDDGEDVDELED